MSDMPHFQPVSSRLGQAGQDPGRLASDSLFMAELESFFATRIRALPAFQGLDELAVRLPGHTGECSGSDPAILCLRPAEWLVVGKPRPDGELPEVCRELAANPGLMTWDDSDGLALVRVKGDAAHWVMRKNSGLDFTVTAGTPDHCAQCKFGRISVIVHFHRDDEGGGIFDLIIDRSLITYFWKLLEATAAHAQELQQVHGDAKTGT